MATSFNYENMQIHMRNLDADFAYFAQTLKKANDMVNDFVNVTPASSIYGEKAKKVLNLWNQNASTFGDFYQNFENWSALMINAANEYHKFENSVFSSHQTTGATADGVAKSREQIKGIPSTSNDNQSSVANDDIPMETLDMISAETVTVTSGQRVNLNGEECYFLMRDSSGNDYYVKSTDANAQVFVADENGNLKPYTTYGSNKIVSREAFVNDRKFNMDYQWNITYNNGTSPYQEVGNQIDSSFTKNVTHADYTHIVYNPEYLQKNAVGLEHIYDKTEGNENFPSVVYVAPGQSIKYDVPWDTYDNVIKGGESGTYLVYNPNMQGYFKIDENGTYNSRNGTEEIRGLWISKEQLLSDRITLSGLVEAHDLDPELIERFVNDKK